MQVVLRNQKLSATKVGRLMDRMYLTFRRHRLHTRQPKQYCSISNTVCNSSSSSSSTSAFGWKGDTNTKGSASGGMGGRITTLADLGPDPEDRLYTSTDFSRYKSSSEEDNESDFSDRGIGGGGGGGGRSRRAKQAKEMKRGGRRLNEGFSSSSATRRQNRLTKRAERSRNLIDREILDSEDSSIVDTDEDNVLDMYGSDAEDDDKATRKKFIRKSSVKGTNTGTHRVGRKNRIKSSYADLDDVGLEMEISDAVIPSAPVKRKQKTAKPTKWTVPVGTEIDREWLQADKQDEQQYCPQLGDQVVYFPQGHSSLLSEFPARDRLLPWNSFNDRWPVVHCEVRDVTFDFPPIAELRRCKSVVATITLVILRAPDKWKLIPLSGSIQIDLAVPRVSRHKENTEHIFQVTIRNWAELPDFIVPYYMFSRAVDCHWRAGMEITADYKATEEELDISGNTTVQYRGRIVTLSQSTVEWPQSPWESLEVLWDTGEEQRLGPWEATLVTKTNTNQILKSTSIAPHISCDEAIRIESVIGTLMADQEQIYGPFEFAVDSEVFPDYYSTVSPVLFFTYLCIKALVNICTSILFNIVFSMCSILLYHSIGLCFSSSHHMIHLLFYLTNF